MCAGRELKGWCIVQCSAVGDDGVVMVHMQALDVANYLHQRYGSLDEQGRSTGSTRLESVTVAVGDGSSPKHEMEDEKVTPVPTLSTVEASSIQHGQEAPLLLGKT